MCRYGLRATVPYWKTVRQVTKDRAPQRANFFRRKSLACGGLLLSGPARGLRAEHGARHGRFAQAAGMALTSRWSTQKVRRVELLREAGRPVEIISGGTGCRVLDGVSRGRHGVEAHGRRVVVVACRAFSNIIIPPVDGASGRLGWCGASAQPPERDTGCQVRCAGRASRARRAGGAPIPQNQ